MDSFYCGALALLFIACLIPFKEHFNEVFQTGILVIMSCIGAVASYYLIPHMGQKCVSKGICGKDINKGTPDPIPESMGIVCGLVFLFITTIFSSISTLPIIANALLVVGFSFMIGLIDDFLDIRWRYKLILSFCSSTVIVLFYPGTCTLFSINFSYVYLLALICLTVFFINSINMYAGINGLESGQCVIIAFFSIIHNVITLLSNPSEKEYNASFASLYLLIPFITVTLVLFYYNKFPSKVFVGDSFAYFAGGVLGVASIIGGYDRLMFCFFFPEFVNFFISIPQLFGFVYCPRHRLPKLNKETGNLECVPQHFTFLNLTLFLVGPKTEHQLVNICFIFHTFSCLVSLIVAYYVFPNTLLDHF